MKFKKLFLLIPTIGLLFSCGNTVSSSSSSSSSVATSSSNVSTTSSSVISSSSVATSSSSISSSSSSQFKPSISSGTVCEPDEGKYKLPDPKLSEEDDEYQIPNSDKVLYRNEAYTTKEDVAAYVMAFGFLPNNYFKQYDTEAQTVCIAKFSKKCRIYKYPYHNDNSGKYDSPYLTDGATDYYEADMESENGSYSSTSRGVYRIVFSIQEGHEILYYTDDHYDHYIEYLNYYGGWGPWFGDIESSKHPLVASWEPATIVENIDFSCFIKQD